VISYKALEAPEIEGQKQTLAPYSDEFIEKPTLPREMDKFSARWLQNFRKSASLAHYEHQLGAKAL
jgi:hypothetical protein